MLFCNAFCSILCFCRFGLYQRPEVNYLDAQVELEFLNLHICFLLGAAYFSCMLPILHLAFYMYRQHLSQRITKPTNWHVHPAKRASVAQLDAPSDWRPGGRGFNPRRGRQHSFVEIDHEIFSTVILSLPLIQEGQLSVSGERMCTILVNRLED